MTFIKYHNPGDRLSISANEWNEIARAVNELRGTTGALRRKAASNPVAYLRSAQSIPQGRIVSISAYSGSDASDSIQQYIAVARARGGMVGVTLTSVSGSGNFPIEVAAPALVDFNPSTFGFNNGVDNYAEVDSDGRAFIVNYQTNVKVLLKRTNNSQGWILPNCPFVAQQPFDAWLTIENGSFQIVCNGGYLYYPDGEHGSVSSATFTPAAGNLAIEITSLGNYRRGSLVLGSVDNGMGVSVADSSVPAYHILLCSVVIGTSNIKINRLRPVGSQEVHDIWC